MNAAENAAQNDWMDGMLGEFLDESGQLLSPAQRKPAPARHPGETKNELGLEVDCVLGEQDAVIKSITENYRNVAGITGASILGDGRVSLILDVTALIQMAADGGRR